MLSLTSASVRQAWVGFLAEREFTEAVTLKPNYRTTELPNYRTEKATAKFLRSAFVRFHRDVDQFLIGPRYHKPSKRHLCTEAVGIVEGLRM